MLTASALVRDKVESSFLATSHSDVAHTNSENNGSPGCVWTNSGVQHHDARKKQHLLGRSLPPLCGLSFFFSADIKLCRFSRVVARSQTHPIQSFQLPDFKSSIRSFDKHAALSLRPCGLCRHARPGLPRLRRWPCSPQDHRPRLYVDRHLLVEITSNVPQAPVTLSPPPKLLSTVLFPPTPPARSPPPARLPSPPTPPARSPPPARLPSPPTRRPMSPLSPLTRRPISPPCPPTPLPMSPRTPLPMSPRRSRPSRPPSAQLPSAPRQSPPVTRPATLSPRALPRRRRFRRETPRR
jgi:hypothetical protein